MEFLKILLNPVALVGFLTMVTVLVAAHEYGHYLFARLFKMEIEEFAIGFGKRKWVYLRKKYSIKDSEGTTEHETLFTVRPWPLGGFVRTAGMQPKEDGSETEVRNGFYSRPTGARWLMLFAGPLFSVLAGLLILIPVYMAAGITKRSTEPVLYAVSDTGAAGVAGLKPGDKIVMLDDRQIVKFFDIVKYVRDRGGKPIKVAYDRNGKRLETTITPKTEEAQVLDDEFQPTGEVREQGRIGVSPGRVSVRLSFGEAASYAVNLPLKMVSGLFSVAKSPKQFEENMGGPMTIFAAVASATESGIAGVLELGGLLSISLGILNLLPIPPFDGGQMMIAFAEMLRGGRRLSYKLQERLFGVGTIAVLLLFVGVMWTDIKRFFLTDPGTAPKLRTQADLAPAASASEAKPSSVSND